MFVNCTPYTGKIIIVNSISVTVCLFVTDHLNIYFPNYLVGHKECLLIWASVTEVIWTNYHPFIRECLGDFSILVGKMSKDSSANIMLFIDGPDTLTLLHYK